MSARTLGPWTWTPKEPHCIDSAEGHVVCGGHDYDEGGIIAEEADARLIAAAPDLLAALKELRELWIDKSAEQIQAAWQRAEAAIRKAEGPA